MGQVARTPQEAQQLEAQDHVKCRNPQCWYYLDPNEFHSGEFHNNLFHCPACKMDYPLLDSTPFAIENGRAVGNPLGPQTQIIPGVRRGWETKVGISKTAMGKIGEEVVKSLSEIPGYGPITWKSPTYNDPVDMGTKDFAIEVKALAVDAKNHTWVIGTQERRQAVLARAQELGYENILALLVIVNFRTSLVDIYGREMGVGEWTTQQGRKRIGPVNYKKHTAEHLIAEFPFDNPFLNPKINEPQNYDLDYDDIPF